MSDQSFYTLTFKEFSDYLLNNQMKEIHAKNVFNSIYKNFTAHFNDIEGVPQPLISHLEKDFSLTLPKILLENISTDNQTVKFEMQLDDQRTVETVLVPFNKKYTVCLSSQVGCAMKCSFCFTGTQGLTRHLRTDEIVGQYMQAFRYIKEHFPNKSAPPNIVFMGQGEPLHNFNEVKKAIEILQTTEGLYLGPRQITLSTAGYMPGIKKFNELKQINFALSFHSPFDSERSQLIPLNNAYPIKEIIDEIKNIKRLKRQYLNFEYLVIKDLNHSIEHVKEIKKLLSDLPVIFNLIPFNPFPGSRFQRPTNKAVEEFGKALESEGFHVMLRTTKGDDILAACGQLNTK